MKLRSVLVWLLLAVNCSESELGAQLVRREATTVNLPAEPLLFSGYRTVNALGSMTFSSPIFVASPPGDATRLFVVERGGRIQMVTGLGGNPVKTEFLDLADVTGVSGLTTESECGLLSLAFHPEYATNREFFIFYSFRSGGLFQRVARMRTLLGNPSRADHGFIEPLVTQADRAGNHNGGTVAFGPDGYLYFSMGDEGASNDSYNQSRWIDRGFFGAICRIDVDRKDGSLTPNAHTAVHAGTYAIPPNNPFLGRTSWHGQSVNPSSVRTEIWATGLRNPFRFSFDAPTGNLFCADVGQGAREEINLIHAGGDYGWSWREGSIAFTEGPSPSTPPSSGFNPVEPIFDYRRSGGGAMVGRSVTGGVVYRGTRMPELVGSYVFADYLSGRIAALAESEGDWQASALTDDEGIVGFGHHPVTGELLLCDLAEGRVKTIEHTGPGEALPATLSATGLFTNVATLQPATGVVPYEVNVSFWSDHAIKRRWFATTHSAGQIGFRAEENWTFPTGMVWVKHFDLDLPRDAPTERRRVETRVLVKTATSVYGLSYRWRSDQSEADLVAAEGLDDPLSGTDPTQTWRFPSRSECLSCHTPQGGYALSFHTAQLNLLSPLPDHENQLIELARTGYLDTTAIPRPGMLTALSSGDDENHSIDWRARSYLSVNCAPCHQLGSASASTWDARHQLALAETGLVNGVAANPGTDPLNRLVVPGDPAHSILLHRIQASDGFDRMPPVGTHEPDTSNAALVAQWIASNFTGSVEINEPPHSTAVSVGEDARFEVTASGVGTLRYQWYQDRVLIPGETGPALTISDAQAEDVAGYSVTVFDDHDAVTSRGALLEVIDEDPRITDQPRSRLARVGSRVEFDATALGRASLRYQWWKNGRRMNDENEELLVFDSVARSNAGRYHVVVGATSETVSELAFLTVIEEADFRANVVRGRTAQLLVRFSGSRPVFAWKHNGLPIGGDHQSLTLRQFSADDEGEYTCEVSAYGQTETLGPYRLRILNRPTSITGPPPSTATVSASFEWVLNSDEPETDFLVSGLPSGLRYDRRTQRIIGTPNRSGSFPVVLIPRNAAGRGEKHSFTLNIAPLPLGDGRGATLSALIPRDPILNANLGGHLRLLIGPTGAASGRLQNGVGSHAVRGRLSVTPGATEADLDLRIARRGTDPLYVRGILALDPPELNCQLILGDSISSVAVEGAAFTDPRTLDPDVVAGFPQRRFQSHWQVSSEDAGSVDLPQGTTWLRVTGGRRFQARAVGRLADGGVLSFSSDGRDPHLVVFRLLHRRKGSVLGRLSIDGRSLLDQVSGDPKLNGAMDWQKLGPTNQRDRFYVPDGFAVRLTTSTAADELPVTGLNRLGVANLANNTLIEFSEGGLADSAQAALTTQTFRMDPLNQVFFDPEQNPTGVWLRVTTASGLFRGGFELIDGSARRRVEFRGLIASDENGLVGRGFFVMPGLPPATAPVLSGAVVLRRSPMLPEPGDFSLRFFGTGSDQVDRVKIRIDGPARPADVGGDFTVEFWVKGSKDENAGVVTAQANGDGWITGNVIMDRDVFGSGDHGDWGISVGGDGLIAFGVDRGGTGLTIKAVGGDVLDGNWHHVAVTRANNGTMQIYIDGVRRAEGTGPTGDISYRNGRTSEWPQSDPYLVFGAEKHDAGMVFDGDPAAYPSFSGWLDEVRISRSLRYSGESFTPPTMKFVPDTDTAGLWHFDEGAGSDVNDSSGAVGGPSHGVRHVGGPSNGPEWSADTLFTDP